MQNSTSLGKKQSLLYAPFSNVGAVTFDQDAVYIDIGRANYTKKEHLSRENNNGEEENEEDEEEKIEFDPEEPAGLLKNLQDVQTGVDKKMTHSTLHIFKGSQAVSGGDNDDDSSSSSSSGSESDDENENESKKEEAQTDIQSLIQPFRRKMHSPESESGSDEDGSDDDDDSDSDDSSSDSDDSDSEKSSPDGEDSYDDDDDNDDNDGTPTTTKTLS
jgi:ribosome biogenesis protein BMS1